MNHAPKRFSYSCIAVATFALFAATATFATSAQAQSTFTVTHPELSPPTLVDLGEPGDSVGDVRLFHFDGQGDDGSAVRVDWTMTTTAIDVPAQGIDSRISTGVFSIGDDASSQLILQGVAHYPGEDATMAVSSSAVRVVTGGSGRFSGARGWVESTHLPDGSWRHTFHLE
jgi:hypothetical protein